MTTSDNDTFVFETSLSAISGFLLSNIRTQMGVNQREIAKIFDMTHVTYGSMERGETSINTDFIYMLCTMVGIKFSDYFSLIDEILFELQNKDSCIVADNIKVNIIPSSEILKIISQPEYKEIEFSKDKKHNLITGESFNFFLSQDIKAKISILSRIRLTKDQIKEMVDLKSYHIKFDSKNKSVIISKREALTLGSNGSSDFTLGGPVGALLSTGGLALYKAYKKVKEDKKK
ncbi:helix-turn-helix domain-containing protein [Acinetobacter sp. ANC 5380]|uniref:Helix-turn-helix domain-containing protein n=1 Tax=Acinetobacter terrae TaxID=2731247 RepID=A0A7Y2WC13_9GAMM|nr:helix-turn-helix domain-containing protein [Acinetobacter terrae]NNH78318.1 helix-turn-helix domain-containing protein [Acinetobacter terrae]